MQAIGVVSRSHLLARVAKNPSLALLNSSLCKESAIGNADECGCTIPPRRQFHSAVLFPVNFYCNSLYGELSDINGAMRIPSLSTVPQARLFSSEAPNNDSADAAKNIYEKMLNCVAEKKTAPPNALMHALVAKCSTRYDIKLLFDILQKLRVFRLSNLRIPDDFNSALCREITKACIRSRALDFGKKTLWKHNIFGLTPDIGSANLLLLHAKQRNDAVLMLKVIKLVKRNDLPLQPGTADIVFSICVGANKFGLLTKYGKMFAASGVKLRQTSFDMWMDFAARKGDVESLWKIENWRSKSMNKHSLSTAFSCAKGFLLQDKPESAAALIQVLYQTLPESRKPNIITELQKLAGEWPLEVIKQQRKENRQALASALQTNISAMINDVLPSLGIKADIAVKNFGAEEAVLS